MEKCDDNTGAWLDPLALAEGRRKELAKLAGLEKAWVVCDQAISANVNDLADALVEDIVEPFWFFRGSLQEKTVVR